MAVPLTRKSLSTFVFFFFFFCTLNVCQDISTELKGILSASVNHTFHLQADLRLKGKYVEKYVSTLNWKNIRKLFGHSATSPSHPKAKQKRENKGHSIQPNLTVKGPNSTFWMTLGWKEQSILSWLCSESNCVLTSGTEPGCSITLSARTTCVDWIYSILHAYRHCGCRCAS